MNNIRYGKSKTKEYYLVRRERNPLVLSTLTEYHINTQDASQYSSTWVRTQEERPAVVADHVFEERP